MYIRNFNKVFEYLIIFKGELYTTHIVVTKRLIQGLLGKPFTKKQIEDTTKYLVKMAETTIDILLDEGKPKRKRKRKRK